MNSETDIFKRKIPTSLEIGARIRAARRARGLTLAQMAQLGPVNAIVLGSYERGARNMPLSRLGQIASVLNIEITELLSPAPILSSNNADGKTCQVIIDLRALSQAPLQERSWFISLRNFCAGITTQRNDWNGEVLSLRQGDLQTLSFAIGTELSKLLLWLESEKLLIKARDRP